MSALPLDGRVALVTGGRGGVGQAVCRRLSAEGATVYAGDLHDNVGHPQPAPAPTETDDGTFIQFDVTSEAEVEAGIERIAADQGRLDIVVNAAGIELEKTVEHTTMDEWNRVFAVNVSGTFLTSKHAIPLLRRSPNGAIVNFGSYDGYIADPELAAYCASKGAVHALTKAMAVDHGADGIRVNAVCPGYVDTPMLQQFFPEGIPEGEVRAEAARLHPLNTIGTPVDMANLVFWLVSDEARYATGQLWVLDGGLSAQVQQMRFPSG